MISVANKNRYQSWLLSTIVVRYYSSLWVNFRNIYVKGFKLLLSQIGNCFICLFIYLFAYLFIYIIIITFLYTFKTEQVAALMQKVFTIIKLFSAKMRNFNLQIFIKFRLQVANLPHPKILKNGFKVFD